VVNAHDLVPEHRLDEDRAELTSSGAALRAHLVASGQLVPRDGRELWEPRQIRAAKALPLEGAYAAGPKVRDFGDGERSWQSHLRALGSHTLSKD
jgi:hypothetical protein